MAYKMDGRIRYSETDPDCRLKTVSLIDYFQDTSTFQTEDCGNGMDFLLSRKKAWMTVYWQIEVYEKPVLYQRVWVETIPYEIKGFLGMRNYRMLNQQGNPLAEADSIWVFMDLEQQRPEKVLSEYVSGYEMGERLPMERLPRKIKIPEKKDFLSSIIVEKIHLDSNGHMNNAQYINIAESCLAKPFQKGRIRVEYRNQARWHDQIELAYAYDPEKNLETVLLYEENRKDIYAIVEFLTR